MEVWGVPVPGNYGSVGSRCRSSRRSPGGSRCRSSGDAKVTRAARGGGGDRGNPGNSPESPRDLPGPSRRTRRRWRTGGTQRLGRPSVGKRTRESRERSKVQGRDWERRVWGFRGVPVPTKGGPGVPGVEGSGVWELGKAGMGLQGSLAHGQWGFGLGEMGGTRGRSLGDRKAIPGNRGIPGNSSGSRWILAETSWDPGGPPGTPWNPFQEAPGMEYWGDAEIWEIWGSKSQEKGGSGVWEGRDGWEWGCRGSQSTDGVAGGSQSRIKGFRGSRCPKMGVQGVSVPENEGSGGISFLEFGIRSRLYPRKRRFRWLR